MKIILLTIISGLLAFGGFAQKLSSKAFKTKILTSEFIFNKTSVLQCHASTVIGTENGILAAWFGGTHERHPDVCIYTSEKRDGQWGAPVLVADGIINDTLRYPCWNPVLFKKDNGDIVLYYKVGPSPREWRGLYKVSTDGGKSWSEEIKIPGNLLGPIKNKPERLKDGTILYPTSYETPEEWAIYVETSDQDINNWQRIKIDNNGFNAIQPTILFHKEGQIQLLCRSKENKIVETWSDDQGKTWTPVVATSLVNNNSGIDAVTLDNGLHLLICNPIEKGRNKLAVLASTDGKNWGNLIVLEDQLQGEFSYPAMIQGKDGTVHITYTYNREKVKYVHLSIQEK